MNTNIKINDKVWVAHKGTRDIESGTVIAITKQNEFVIELDTRGYTGIFTEKEVGEDELEALIFLENLLDEEYDGVQKEIDDKTAELFDLQKILFKLHDRQDTILDAG